METMFDDYFAAYKNTYDYKDRAMIDMVIHKQEYETNLDEMWAIYSRGNIQQIGEYNKGIDQIKKAGLKVYRNSTGKHKIVIPK